MTSFFPVFCGPVALLMGLAWSQRKYLLQPGLSRVVRVHVRGACAAAGTCLVCGTEAVPAARWTPGAEKGPCEVHGKVLHVVESRFGQG